MEVFERVPAELLLDILEMSSPIDVISTINASPTFRRAFNERPVSVLRTALARALEPEALQAALALAYLEANGSFDDPSPQAASAVALLRRRQAIGPQSPLGSLHMALYPIGGVKIHQFEFPTEPRYLMSMCRLHGQVAKLTSQYAASAAAKVLEFCEEIDDPARNDAKQWRPITTTERTRFERAFYHLELLAKLSRNPGEYFQLFQRPAPHTAIKKAHVLERLLDYEWAEILCVHHFLRTVMRKHVCDLRDQFVEAVKSSPGVQLPPESSAMNVAGSTPSSDMWNLRWLALRGLNIYTEYPKVSTRVCNTHSIDRRPSNGWLSLLALKGVKFANQLSSSAPDAISQALRVEKPREGQGETYTAKFPIPYVPPEANGPEGIDAAMDCDEHGTAGYRMFEMMRPMNLRRCHEYSSDPLREMAYMFWDADRINVAWVKATLEGAACLEDTHLKGRCDEAWGPCCEERLDGVKLPKAEFENMQKRFGPN